MDTGTAIKIDEMMRIATHSQSEVEYNLRFAKYLTSSHLINALIPT